jgi:c-di-GMP-binding flagellar brake protein YcgR
MFFKKKPARPARREPADKRQHYRKLSARSQPLESLLKVAGWSPVPVELVDLTVRGAGIAVPFARDRNLKVGDLVELTIVSLMRTEVVAAAKVANVGKRGQGQVRYGLEFLDLGKLYAQLDEFYARHFNRRRAVRVKPWLDRKVKIELRWGSESMSGPMYDLSTQGVGVVLTREAAKRLAEIPSVSIAFRLPGAEAACNGRAAIRHRSPIAKNVLVGLQFDSSADGMRKHEAQVRRFIVEREREMSKWEDSWS